MIKKLIFITLAVLCLILPFLAKESPAAVNEEKVDVVFFSSPYCGYCKKCAAEFLPGFIEANKDRINFIEHNIFEEGKNTIFYDAIREYGQASSGVPAMVIGDSYFVGYPHQIGSLAQTALNDAIEKRQKTRVRKLPATPLVAVQSTPKNLPQANVAQAQQPSSTKSIFESITFWAIIGAGLVDGINPCAFAVIVFFVSFLAVYKYDKVEIMIVGICYCLSVFVAYILLGLGLFNFLYAMGSFYYLIAGFKWLTIGLCAIFFLLSMYDFMAYKITGRADKIILQLPKSYKEYIHKIMRYFLKDKQKSTLRLILASASVGFIVSLVEAVCTGQVYLPTIVLILKEADTHFWRAVSYLLIYNFMFIVPLIVILIFTLLGYQSKGFNDLLKKHLALTKFLLAMVFLALFILLIMAM